ncbi:MAG: hypothetical protein ABI072_05495 [Edaphobacter sp.]
MAQGLDSTKSGERPSHEAIEDGVDATEVGKSEQHKIDHIAMQMAKRAENRIERDKETTPGNTIFTK